MSVWRNRKGENRKFSKTPTSLVRVLRVKTTHELEKTHSLTNLNDKL